MFEEGLTIMASLGTEGFKKGSMEIDHAVKSLSNSAKKFNMKMTGSIRRLIPMIIGVGSAYQIISKGVSAFMSQNEELSARMNSIWTACGNLLGPIVTQIINWITNCTKLIKKGIKNDDRRKKEEFSGVRNCVPEKAYHRGNAAVGCIPAP